MAKRQLILPLDARQKLERNIDDLIQSEVKQFLEGFDPSFIRNTQRTIHDKRIGAVVARDVADILRDAYNSQSFIAQLRIYWETRFRRWQQKRRYRQAMVKRKKAMA